MIYGRQKSEKDDTNVPLFKNVKYYLHKTLSLRKQRELENKLQEHNAQKAENEQDATHIIATKQIELAKEHENEPPFIVTPAWVEKAEKNKFVHDAQYYSTDPSFIFSGMVLTAIDVPVNDAVVFCASMQQLGGQYLEKYSPETTHLVTSSARSKTVRDALVNGAFVVTPHFIQECIKFRRRVREDPYQYTCAAPEDPSAMVNEPAHMDTFEKNLEREVVDTKKAEKQLYQPINKDSHPIFPPYDSKFNKQKGYVIDTGKTPQLYMSGECLYVEPDLIPEVELLDSWLDYLKKAGATIASEYNKDQVTTVVVKDRSTPVYKQASKDGKVVASTWWLTNTIMRGEKHAPTSTLVDYPMPRGGIPGSQAVIVTITGYRDTARDYLRRLAIHCGMDVHNGLARDTTHLVCISQDSAKWRPAKNMNIPVVNHIWLEECFRDWTIYPTSDTRFIHLPASSVLRTLVGKTEIDLEFMSRWWKGHQPEQSHLLLVKKDAEEHGPQQSRREAAKKAGGMNNRAARDMNNFERENRAKRTQGPRQKVTAVEMEDHGIEDKDSTNEQKEKHLSASDDGAEKSTSTEELSTKSVQRHKRRNGDDDNGGEQQIATSDTDAQHSDGASNACGQRSIKRQKSNKSKDEEETVKDKDTEKQKSPSPAPEEPSSSRRSRSRSSEKEPAKRSRKSTGKKIIEELIESSQAIKTPERRKVLFTGFMKGPKETIANRIQKKLGADSVEDVEKADCVVAGNKMVRTPNCLSAINLGLPVVTEDWVNDSLKAGELLDTEEYVVSDPEKEEKYCFNLRESLEIARENRKTVDRGHIRGTLLEGYNVFSVSSDKETRKSLRQIVKCAGGEFVEKEADLDPSNTDVTWLVISDPDKKGEQAKRQALKKKGFTIYDMEMILTGTLQQKLDLQRII
ncbi:hypothetical protein BDB00DRAFT_974414 [Zychaea mexicana]|uniref:uncharacterized protein n=1 Tax=Zychaea mexicana TaxID=64656 RepID=UPI0022FE8128|nr:uncharacterized protein BDB00DRAFT_974414 [Zychaea mexicana]KAI9494375.1 hypothetical protein BDB00DRAFT_974414 [Zychaea mexicana]